MGQAKSKQDKELMRNYDLEKSDIKTLRETFKEGCGKRKTLTRTEFHNVYSRLFPGDTKDYVDQMFRISDVNQDGEVDFEEFVRSVCLCDSKNIEEKIQIAFALYDRDSSGTISRTEVSALLTAYFDMKGDGVGKQTNDLAEDFFKDMDADGNDEVTYEEFYAAAMRNSSILNILNPVPPDWE